MKKGHKGNRLVQPPRPAHWKDYEPQNNFQGESINFTEAAPPEDLLDVNKLSISTDTPLTTTPIDPQPPVFFGRFLGQPSLAPPQAMPASHTFSFTAAPAASSWSGAAPAMPVPQPPIWSHFSADPMNAIPPAAPYPPFAPLWSPLSSLPPSSTLFASPSTAAPSLPSAPTTTASLGSTAALSPALNPFLGIAPLDAPVVPAPTSSPSAPATNPFANLLAALPAKESTPLEVGSSSTARQVMVNATSAYRVMMRGPDLQEGDEGNKEMSKEWEGDTEEEDDDEDDDDDEEGGTVSIPPESESLRYVAQSEADRHPSRNPAMPPTDTSPFASLHLDLLRVVLEKFFGLTDLLILRLVCKRWLEAIRGMRLELDLLVSHNLTEPTRLQDMHSMIPNLRTLRIEFAATYKRVSLPRYSSRWKRSLPALVVMPVKNEDLIPLFAFAGLTALDLLFEDQRLLTSAPFAHINQLQHLRQLSFSYRTATSFLEGDAIGDAIVCKLSAATTLTELVLRIPQMTSRALYSLSSLRLLTHLDLCWSARLTSVAPVLELHALEQLLLAGCVSLTADEVLPLAKMPNLKRLTFSASDHLLETFHKIRQQAPSLNVIRD